MRTFSVLIFTFSLVCAVRGETEHKNQATHAKASQHAPTHPGEHPGGHHGEHPGGHHGEHPGGHPGHPGPPAGVPPEGPGTAPAGNAAAKPAAPAPPAPVYHYNFRTPSGLIGIDFAKPLTSEEQSAIAEKVGEGQPEGPQVRPGVASTTAKVHPFPSQHFDLPNKLAPGIENVKFQPGGHIPECEKWRDSRYDVFRKYTATWHDADWWRNHHPRIVFVLGGWYYWQAGYWYPAWGYESQAVYPYDGPIYAFNDLSPDQVVANVQAALQSLGYYRGPINGLLSPATREALANYQRDQGLYATSAIDEPTLAALGMT